MPLIKQFGLHWPRNPENLEEIEDLAGHKSGIYVLYHGAMPVYIGRGAISARLLSHAKEGSKKEQFWDRFSWFVIGNAKRERDRPKARGGGSALSEGESQSLGPLASFAVPARRSVLVQLKTLK